MATGMDCSVSIACNVDSIQSVAMLHSDYD